MSQHISRLAGLHDMRAARSAPRSSPEIPPPVSAASARPADSNAPRPPAAASRLLRGEDDTKIGQPRHHQVSQTVESLVILERARQHVAGIGQKGEPLLPRFRFRQRRLLANEFLPLFRLPFDLLRLFEEIDKDRDLGPQDFRHDRREDVINRA